MVVESSGVMEPKTALISRTSTPGVGGLNCRRGRRRKSRRGLRRARRLTTESASAFPKHPQLSLLLAVEAVKIGQSLPEVQETVRQSLTEALEFVRGRPLIGGRPLVVSHTDISAMAISPDNHWLATGSLDNTAHAETHARRLKD